VSAPIAGPHESLCEWKPDVDLGNGWTESTFCTCEVIRKVRAQLQESAIGQRVREETAQYLAVCDALERCSFDRHRLILDGERCANCGLTLGDYLAIVPTHWPTR
jgi:ERCC4-type nuclease